MRGLPKVDMVQTGEMITELRRKNNMTVAEIREIINLYDN